MKREPWFPAEYDERHIAAVKAVAEGEATSDQQKLALAWIVNDVSMTGQQSFVPGKADVTNFIEGRRSVGNQILKLVRDLRAPEPKR